MTAITDTVFTVSTDIRIGYAK